ncbi:MAG: hypothetical protein O2841_03040 [Actinomycetota bacterium]|nr:hypothetical protein [Actinomycetota bacterium]
MNLKFVAVIATVLGLCSCQVNTVVTLDVGQNGAGVVTVNIIADSEVLAIAPNLADDLRFDDATAAGWVVARPNKTVDGGLQVSLTHTFDNAEQAGALLTQLSGEFGPFKQMSLTRSGKDTDSTFKLDGSLQADGGLSAFADARLLNTIGGAPFAENLRQADLDLGKAMTIDFVAILPGVIERTTGIDTENTVTWRVPLDGSEQSVLTTSRNTAVKATVARLVANLFKFLLFAWLLIMFAIILRVAYKRRGASRTPSE